LLLLLLLLLDDSPMVVSLLALSVSLVPWLFLLDTEHELLAEGCGGWADPATAAGAATVTVLGQVL
jgi:hypothetical protein